MLCLYIKIQYPNKELYFNKKQYTFRGAKYKLTVNFRKKN